jgi:uncharacterized membrane protein YgcG
MNMNRFLLKIILLTFLGTWLSGGSSASALGQVNDFEIQQYRIDYVLSRDTEGRSVLKTTEIIKAEFPQTDQNHGIERAIPTHYDGHPTSLAVTSVTNAQAAPLPYTAYDLNGNTVLRIGDADTYVHGLQTYKLTYMQRDVTKYFGDTNADEFYWDTNGTEWAVPIKALDVRLRVDDALLSSLTNKQHCYFGQNVSTDPCDISFNRNTFGVAATQVKPGENLTIAVGFKPHTFAAYKQSVWMTLVDYWAVALFLTSLPAAALLIWFLARRYRRSYRIAEIGTIVPEYIPPSDASVSVSARIVRKYGSVFSAQLIDLAVRHYIRIYQTREKSLFKSANYELEVVKVVDDLKAEEQEVLKDIFGGTPQVGARLDMATLKRNRAVSLKLSDNQRKLDKSIAGNYKLKAHSDVQSAWFKKAAVWTSVAAVLTLSPWLLIAAMTSVIIAATMKPLTDKGLALQRYLAGLEMYIKVAETERLRMLQSPEGSSKLPASIDTNDQRQLVTLYERVLPYAMIFGLEKEWNKQLGSYYESLNESPSWYVGNGAVFNAAVFSSAISDFSQVATYSDPTSSSSGGSSGGGSSGGGGGGGGGGGW